MYMTWRLAAKASDISLTPAVPSTSLCACVAHAASLLCAQLPTKHALLLVPAMSTLYSLPSMHCCCSQPRGTIGSQAGLQAERLQPGLLIPAAQGPSLSLPGLRAERLQHGLLTPVVRDPWLSNPGLRAERLQHGPLISAVRDFWLSLKT